MLDLMVHTIPAVLRAQPYVLWRAEPREGKPAKIPYRISEPTQKASSTNPETWGAFWDAVDAYALLSGTHRDPDPALGPLMGIGVVLTAEAHITCLDLDHVLLDGVLDPRAARLVARLASWTEISPSGTGLHCFVRGTLPEALKGLQFEAYATGRYIAITGHRWPGTPDHLVDRQSHLDQLLDLAQQKVPIRPPYTGPFVAPPDDLGGALLAKVQTWELVVIGPLKRWQDGYLIELARCPWAETHSAGSGGAAVMIRASGAFDFTCLHAHCEGRTWRDFRTVMESR